MVDVVPESEGYLEQVVAAGDELVAVHLVDVQPQVTRWTLDGEAPPSTSPVARCSHCTARSASPRCSSASRR